MKERTKKFIKRHVGIFCWWISHLPNRFKRFEVGPEFGGVYTGEAEGSHLIEI